MGVLMSWDEGQTLASRWDHACAAAGAVHPHWHLGASYSGFTQALVRETPRLVEAVKGRLRRAMRALPRRHWRYAGWEVFAVDGSRQEAPHTRANEAGLGCAGRTKTAPQVFLTVVWHVGLGLPWDFRVGPGTDSERQHVMGMADDLPPRALLVADAGFAGYELCRELARGGRSFLLRVGGNIRLLERLGYYRREGDGTVYLWPQDRQVGRHRGRPLVLRLIRLRSGEQALYLLTNVLSRGALSDGQARRIFAGRWGEEVFYRSYKQTLRRRTLLSRTPATCLAESQWTLLGLWLLGLLTLPALTDAGGDPKAWSVAASRDLVRQALRDEAPRRHRRQPLRLLLSRARTDTYRRTRPKAARNYPRKKREKPPGPPRLDPALPLEIKRARRLEPPTIPRRWTA
jgi:hypothetical protein